MKKCIIFQLFLSQLMVLYIDAMQYSQVKANPQIPVGNICRFTLLPFDVCNHIASFLVWETKRAFVKRTRIEPGLSSSWHKFLTKNKYDCGLPEESFQVLCPDETKMALVKLFFYDRAKPHLTIIDKSVTKDNILYEGEFPHRFYQHIALASNGYMIATIQKLEPSEAEIMRYYRNVLVIQKIMIDEKNKTRKLNEVKNVVLLNGFDPMALAFNKQDTHLIMHGAQYGNGKDSQKNYKILRLEDPEVKLIDYHCLVSKTDKKNLLQDYFRRCMICKKYSK